MKSERSLLPVRADSLYKHLRKMILEGQLSPGQRLVERELARAMKVSRIPLRETLIRLESEGLVRSVANTATFVEEFAPPDLMEIYTMRLVLEPLAARLAAGRTSAELVRTLRQLCADMTRYTLAAKWKQLDSADYEFHHTTVEASQHQRLIRAYNFSQIRILGGNGEFGTPNLKTRPPETTAREHEQIVNCIERGDAAGAERANYEHVEVAMKGFQIHYGFLVQSSGLPVRGRK